VHDEEFIEGKYRSLYRQNRQKQKRTEKKEDNTIIPRYSE
jgi:hypothetical protein